MDMKMQSISVMVVATLCSLSWASDLECPNINHCLASESRCVVTGISSPSCFQKSMEHLQGSRKKLVVFDKLNLSGGLPEMAFSGAEFEFLMFKDYRLKNLGAGTISPFFGDHSIKKLYFLSPLEDMRKWKFSQLNITGLTDLTFSNVSDEYFSMGKTLPKSFQAAGSGSVRNLQFTSSCLEQLEDGSLSTFANLERLSLVGNRLATIRRAALPFPANKLTSIDLGENKISKIKRGQFWDPMLPNLKEVNLENNALTEVDKEFLLGTNLKKFYINGNKSLNCTSMSWILDVDQRVWLRPGGPPAVCFHPIGLRRCHLHTLSKQEIVEEEPTGGKCPK